MSLTRSKPLLFVTGLTAALALSSCAGSAAQKEGDAQRPRRSAMSLTRSKPC